MKPPNLRTDLWSVGHRVWYVTLVVYALMLLAMTQVSPTLREWEDQIGFHVSQMKGPVSACFWLVPLAATVAVLVMSVKGVFPQVRWLRWIGLCLVLLAFPYCCLFRLMLSLAPWTSHGTYTDATGQQFIFLDSSFWQGQTMALGIKEPGGLLYQDYRIFGSTNGDSPRSYATMIRTTDQHAYDYGCLVPTPDRKMLLGLRVDNQCYFSFEFANGNFKRWDDIEKISPFALVLPDSKLRMGDVQLLRERWDWKNRKGSQLPWAKALIEGLSHPNHEVQVIAKELCERYEVDETTILADDSEE